MRELFCFNEEYQQVAVSLMNQVIKLAQEQNQQGLQDLKAKYRFSVNGCIYNETALFKLAKMGKQEAVHWLIAFFHGDPQEALRGAAFNGLIEFTYALMDTYELHDYFAVLGAASGGQKAFAQELLKKYGNRSLDAAVYGAAIYGDIPWVLSLLDQGANYRHAIKGAVAGLRPFLLQKIMQRTSSAEIYFPLVLQTLYEYGHSDKYALFFDKPLSTFSLEVIMSLLYRAASNGDIKNIYSLLEYVKEPYGNVLSQHIRRGAIRGGHPELLITLFNKDNKQYIYAIKEVIKQARVDFIHELISLEHYVCCATLPMRYILNAMFYPNEKIFNEIMKYMKYNPQNMEQFIQIIVQPRNKRHLDKLINIKDRPFFSSIFSKIRHDELRNDMLLLPDRLDLRIRPDYYIRKNQLEQDVVKSLAPCQKIASKTHDLIECYDIKFKLASRYVLLTPSVRWWLLQGFSLTTGYHLPKLVYFHILAAMFSERWSFSELKALAVLTHTILHNRVVARYSACPVIVQKARNSMYHNCYVYTVEGKTLGYYTSNGKYRSMERIINPEELRAIKVTIDKKIPKDFSSVTPFRLDDSLIRRKNHLFFKSAYEQQCAIRHENRIKFF